MCLRLDERDAENAGKKERKKKNVTTRKMILEGRRRKEETRCRCLCALEACACVSRETTDETNGSEKSKKEKRRMDSYLTVRIFCYLIFKFPLFLWIEIEINIAKE